MSERSAHGSTPMLFARAPRFAILLPLVVLAACGGAGPVTHADGGPAVSATSADVTKSERREQTAALPRHPGSVAEPARLKGLMATQVKAVLGAPAFTRRDTPAEIWQYRASACTLDLFLYDEKDGQVVAHYNVRSTSGVGDKDCFDTLTGSKSVPTS